MSRVRYPGKPNCGEGDVVTRGVPSVRQVMKTRSLRRRIPVIAKHNDIHASFAVLGLSNPHQSFLLIFDVLPTTGRANTGRI